MKCVMCIVHCAARAAHSLASELLRLVEVLVLNEVVEEGGAGRPASLLGPPVVSLSPPCTSTSVLMCDLVVLHGTTGAGAPMSCFSP